MSEVVSQEKVKSRVEKEGTYIVTKQVRPESEESGRDAERDLKTAKDGKTVLIPQPSNDPEDPLNWSWTKKHAVFLALIPGCLLTDWVITWGATLFEQQAMDWHMKVPDVANSISGAIFMQGPGGLLAVPLCQRYGRFPVLFWSQFLTLVCSIGAALAHNYAGFTACRTLQGFFGAPPQVIGLSIIHDMFFFHERARKVNIWAFSFLLGPYLGPFISGFIAEKLWWRDNFAVLCGFYGFSVLTIILLGDETLYDRNAERKPRQKGILGRLSLLTGVTGFQERDPRPTLWTVLKDIFGLLLRPYLLLPTFGFVTFLTMWTIGIVSTITQFVAPPPYRFSHASVGLLFFAPMIGTLCAELWGHWFNDFLCQRYIRTHGGKYVPENRLWAVYPAWLIGIIGLIVFGQTLQHNLHWIGVAIGWGLNCFSTLGTTTAISAYILDVFPQHSALASAWICAFRTVGGFTVVYFQLKWVNLNGPGVAFGCQAAIVAGVVASIVVTQVFGKKWRAKFPAPAAEN
ncbi:MFS general substrate transporter [Eremomyces bilateralis CBS 781.70]|uniref:MFS general substrate transporter n=1 Tax=Eremomyces bilateralis CBS 781.70 TaxID=1392243 RepID=A0A6G1FRI9_9PEZI|nr:MFS general substrate transporter [Eremomyces bilateralis CBS 781.70]KAF1808393.1 MFS general substrate transporter [Eremomyces bilateralis CBS 781.70]